MQQEGAELDVSSLDGPQHHLLRVRFAGKLHCKFMSCCLCFRFEEAEKKIFISPQRTSGTVVNPSADVKRFT